MDTLTDDFIKGALALSPVTATQAGYHTHNGAALDEQIDDLSTAGIDAQRRFYQDMQRRIAALDPAALDREQQADVQIIKNNVGLSLLELDTIQAFRHNPTVYVELAGNALYVPYVLNYAPAETRFRHIVKRLERIPALVQQAKDNLLDAPDVWNRVAREENDGNIGLFTASVISLATNGFLVWATYQTNAAPGSQLTNLPPGSILSTTNGQMYVLSNLVLNLK